MRNLILLFFLCFSYASFSKEIQIEVYEKGSSNLIAGDKGDDKILTVDLFKAKTGIDYIQDVDKYDILVIDIDKMKADKIKEKADKNKKIEDAVLTSDQISKAIKMYLKEKEIDIDNL